MSHPVITSVHNPRVKEWAGLLERKGRQKQGKFLLEGVRLVEEALKSHAPVETVLYSADRGIPAELARYAHDDAREWLAVSEAVLAKCCDADTPQGVVAVVRKSPVGALEAAAAPNALVVAVDGVQDPGNLGTIIRSADAAGATAVVLGRGTVDLYNPKTLRATMGSLFHLPVIEADLPSVLQKLPADRLQVIGTSLQAKESCYETDFTRPTWLIFGNEGAGVSPQVAAFVRRSVRIPMPGRAESLNVAMAATVLLFEAARQRAFCTNKIPESPTN